MRFDFAEHINRQFFDFVLYRMDIFVSIWINSLIGR